MWSRRKKVPDELEWRGAAQAALSGASRERVMLAALRTIAGSGRTDRVGVWLGPDYPVQADPQAPAILCGILRESDSSQVPRDWERLSLEPPLPLELLAAGKSVEQELSGVPAPVVGPLMGLRRALWTPVRRFGQLHGVILSGAARAQGPLPRELAESVAAELSFAFGFREDQQLARERQHDLAASKQLLAAMAGGGSTDTILSQLVAGCTERSADGSGPEAVFVAIGYTPVSLFPSPEEPEMEFAWKSGDPVWAASTKRDPLRSLWLQALEANRVAGAELPASWPRQEIERLVAIPLNAGREKLGVFLAGLAPKSASLRALDRLELRASLAACALERRRQSTERTRHLARRQALLEISPDPTVLVDGSGLVVGLNRRAKALLEETPTKHSNEALAADFPQPAAAEAGGYMRGRLAQLFFAHDQPRVEEWVQTSLASDRDKLGLQPVPPSNCEAALVSGVRIRLRAPIAAGDDLAAVILDSLVAQESALQHSRFEAELLNVLEWVEEGILLFGTNNSIRAMNTRFAQIAGLSADEAASCTNLDTLIACLAERAAEPELFGVRWRELARRAEGGHREEVQLVRPVPRVLERSVRAMFDHLGRRLGRVEIYRDLSAHRVFQARLLQTEKLAALGQLITGVAHELSSPLTSILGYAQRLLVRKDLAGSTEEARQIYQEAERASAILRQLLLTARESRPERKKVSLNQIVLRTMELQRFGSAAEKIHIEMDLDPALPFVNGDAGKLQQVLMNLIGNARQAIVQEGRAGTIQLRTARSGERSVVLEVSDDGPGIPQAILARIFDPFFTTKPPDVGTGLGLSIVLSVVREHGGQVKVSSPPGSGACFVIELPIAAEASAGSFPPATPATEKKAKPAQRAVHHSERLHAVPSSSPHARHRDARVLVLEDEPTVARLIADVLEDEGLRVDVLLDGREALERVARESYDLVICDMKMPALDGQQFYESLAAAHTDLPGRFLFVTGDVIAAQTQEFLERHGLPHVAKPFRIEELSEKVFSLLDSHLARGAHAAAAKKGR